MRERLRTRVLRRNRQCRAAVAIKLDEQFRLGFHAFRGIAEKAASTDNVQSIVADMLRYGKTVNAPIDLLIEGFATPSDNIFWVLQADVCALGIKLWSNDTKRFVCN